MAKKVHIKFLKAPAHLGMAYHKGQEAKCDSKIAKELIETGYAEAVNEMPQLEPVENSLPADTPYFKLLLENEVTSLDKLTALEDLTKLKGIGEAKAEEIKEWFVKRDESN